MALIEWSLMQGQKELREGLFATKVTSLILNLMLDAPFDMNGDECDKFSKYFDLIFPECLRDNTKSYILPSYNTQKLLLEAYESLQNEDIVILDGPIYDVPYEAFEGELLLLNFKQVGSDEKILRPELYLNYTHDFMQDFIYQDMSQLAFSIKHHMNVATLIEGVMEAQIVRIIDKHFGFGHYHTLQYDVAW